MSEMLHRRFVRKIHRRLVIIRAMENMGICISIAIAIAMPILALRLWRGQTAIGLLPILAALASFAAFMLTMLRRPTLMQAAAEADRQLNLDDLLATALQLAPLPSDAMIAPVLVMADARCRQISPSAVILNRFGARAWGGVVLLLATMMAVSLLPSHPIPTAQAGGNPSILSDPQPADQLPASKSAPNTGPAADSENFNRMPSTIDNGSGGDFAAATHSSLSTSLPPSALGKRTDSLTGIPSGGGASGENAPTGESISGPGNTTTHRNINPWQATGGNINPSTLDPAAQNIPAQDRDLVQGFFDRN